MEEKIYTIPLGKAYDYIRTKRARRAVVIVQQFVARHSKVVPDGVRLSNALNSALWKRGIQKPPRKIKIKVVKEAEFAKAYLPEEQIKKPEPKKEKKEAKAETKTEEKKIDAKPDRELPRSLQAFGRSADQTETTAKPKTGERKADGAKGEAAGANEQKQGAKREEVQKTETKNTAASAEKKTEGKK